METLAQCAVGDNRAGDFLHARGKVPDPCKLVVCPRHDQLPDGELGFCRLAWPMDAGEPVGYANRDKIKEGIGEIMAGSRR